MGHNFGQIAPQIRGLDVFYTMHPVVGFHIVGDPENPGPMLGLHVVGDPDPATPITGFQPIGELPLEAPAGFSATEADETSPQLLGLELEETIQDSGTSAPCCTEEQADEPIQGFQATEDSPTEPPIMGPEVVDEEQ